jgi:hypothetical protein
MTGPREAAVSSPETLPPGARRDAEGALEMLPQGCRRAESGQRGDLLDRVVGRLQQLLAARQPFAEQPRADCVSGQLAEMPGEGPAVSLTGIMEPPMIGVLEPV